MLHILIHELAHALTAAMRQAHDCTAIGPDAGEYAFPYIAGYAGQKDGTAIITRLMDTIQQTAAQIIEAIETRQQHSPQVRPPPAGCAVYGTKPTKPPDLASDVYLQTPAHPYPAAQ